MRREDVVRTINNLKGESGHQRVLDVYNSQKPLPRSYKLQYKDPWCAATVTAVFIMNGYDAISECSCIMMVQKAKDLGIWIEDDAYEPKPGDVIMYDWQDSGSGDNMGTPDHVGIVIKVDKNKIVVREGNKNKTVGNRDITVDGIHIRGYITPPYEADSGLLDEEVVNAPPKEEKPEEKAQTKREEGYYKVGNTYTIRVNTALNVRKGPSKQYGTVGYRNLTADGKKHAFKSGALKNGTRVTVKAIEIVDGVTWLRIPSGWICADTGSTRYVI